MHDEEKTQIKDLERKISDIRKRVQREGRNLYKHERALILDMETSLSDIKRSLPENEPLTLGLELRRGYSSGGDEFRSPGEELQAIIKAGTPGNAVDPRLESRAASGLGETIPSEGGFVLSTDFSTQILELSHDISPVAGLCNRISISSGANAIDLPAVDETSRVDGSRWGGIVSYWLAEGAEKLASKPKFRRLHLELKKVIGLCYVTDELIQDASALQKVVTQGFAEELAFRVDDAVLNGSGVGQPLGILKSGCVVTVDKESGQKAATIVFENIVKMWSRCLGRSRKTAVWLISQSVEPQLYTMSLAVGTGGIPVYMPAGGASAAPYATLFGRPVIPCEQCQTLGTAGDIILADLQSYLLIDKGGLQSDVSIHVRFVYDESCLRFVYRCDGQPIYGSAITPFKGSATQSPFVILQTRS